MVNAHHGAPVRATLRCSPSSISSFLFVMFFCVLLSLLSRHVHCIRAQVRYDRTTLMQIGELSSHKGHFNLANLDCLPELQPSGATPGEGRVWNDQWPTRRR